MSGDVTIFSSATEQLAALATRELSSVELLDAYLAQIAEHDWVRAIVTLDAERARDEARAADRARAQGRSLGPLHGLPMTVKHDVEVAGMLSTYGALATRDHRPQRDAESVRRLRTAGAIVFGRSNLPEYARDGQSYNELHGTTNNPWDRERTPGGSSGGSAAALAAGMTSLELGSDMGGSIRLPASWCGVHGLKPTWGIVPTSGEVPTPGTPRAAELHQGDIAVAGPLARGAVDLDLALTVLTQPVEPAGGWTSVSLPEAPFSGHRKLRAALWLDDDLPAATATRRVLEAACEALGADGVTIDREALPPLSLERFEELFEMLFMADIPMSLDDESCDMLASALQSLVGQAPLAKTHLRALRLSHREWLWLERARLEARRGWSEFFESVDVLLCPTVIRTAIRHDHSEPMELRTMQVDGTTCWHRPWLTRWCAPASVSYLPAVSAPAGLSSDGLPVGIQIIAGQYRDRSAIAAARLLEQSLGGFRIPPLADSRAVSSAR